MAAPKRWLTNVELVAHFFEVSPNTMRAWLKQGAPGRTGSKGYDVFAVAVWIWRKHRTEIETAKARRVQERVGLELAILKATAELKQLQAEAAAERYVLAEAARADVDRIARDVRATLERIPERMKAPPAIKREMKRQIANALRALVAQIDAEKK